MIWVSMAAKGMGSLLCIDNVTVTTEVRCISDRIQPNAPKLIERCFKEKMDNNHKHTTKANFESQRIGYSLVTKVLKTKLKVKRPTNKRQLKVPTMKVPAMKV